ncbi:RNA polymerase sigma factor [Gimesia panareensis]|uniref:RNA polymerase sigma factor n=1 Tax=Gimesia panareensis TaxID=2527978 RepID=A0A518FMK8_9PLAN|nr:sigma-70 family RNA polymerase sigma factor [Gimesia panareensis]QDV17592.1 RNA polymerase sigma factor [Gimesia panareensis]
MTNRDLDEEYVALIAGSQPVLRGLLVALIRRAADVDDVLQETNTVLWRKRDEYDRERAFLPWACRIAQLQALAFFKRVRNDGQAVLEERTLEQIAAATTRRALEAKSHAEALTHCMEKLPSSHRQLVESRYRDAVPVNQIAADEGRSADAVSMTLYRIRKTLMECIQKTMAREAQT